MRVNMNWWWKWWWWICWCDQLMVVVVMTASSDSFAAPAGTSCDFERQCAWEWNASGKGFVVTTGDEVNATFHSSRPGIFTGPFADSKASSNGHFLFLRGSSRPHVVNVTSPWFQQSGAHCRMSVMLHMKFMNEGKFKVIVQTKNVTWFALETLGDDKNQWEKHIQNIGKVEQPFRIILEVEQSLGMAASHFAMDDLKLLNCFPESPPRNECSRTEFRCNNNLCIDASRVCDITEDCLGGEDEQQDCDLMPWYARCSFEDGWCGWHNQPQAKLQWRLHNGSTPTEVTGPSWDHTYQNGTGMYVYLPMKAKAMMTESGVLKSWTFPPPPRYHSNPASPYYNSCQVRFNYHQYGPHSGSLELYAVVLNPRSPTGWATQLFRSYGDKKDIWHFEAATLPNIRHSYYLEFRGMKGIRYRGDIAVDDISVSPKCLGIGVPPNETEGWNVNITSLDSDLDDPLFPRPSNEFANLTKYSLGSCGATGRYGPTPFLCNSYYRNTSTNVTVLTDGTWPGAQVWTVPESGFYTVIAKGASGGKGVNSISGVSKGAVAHTVVQLRAGEKIHVIVGQEGIGACRENNTSAQRRQCSNVLKTLGKRSLIHELKSRLENFVGGGGAGGGGTFIFSINPEGTAVPILVAAGAGGLAYNLVPDKLGKVNGQGVNTSIHGGGGYSRPEGAGPGGGWFWSNSTNESAGQALLEGALGGIPCTRSKLWGTEGGFGGGGGGCLSGGGGGGYTGGNASSSDSANGDGGLSSLSGMMAGVIAGAHDGPGEAHFIPATEGCGCVFLCVVIDDLRRETRCLCPDGWVLERNGHTCKKFADEDDHFPMTYVVTTVIVALIIFVCVGAICMFLYNRYQKQKVAILRRKMLNGPDLQLNRLRTASGGMVTEYNPNYEFGGGTYTIHDLKEIPRENLRLVKALGQGAFGEVYQGFFRHRAGDAVEMPVAVKTLPELSSNQAEMDFLMEALIMSKFSHPNIVHFIGVCFDKHPRFIVLELLAGGDLKTFLRESRPKPVKTTERPSPLTMKDLLVCSMDVAKGCKYLEENHFIHRDIAARNCLLTTKGPGRVVKIADFGMARDIYRADYYRKGGKAMLPVKWMPPEAFLDGIFTSKTDVWSFGVLLWEVMSLGYMPYPGRGNQEVMQLVTNGGRLEPPSNCPSPVYGIMTQCWHPMPDERPTFTTIIERIGYCLQDPEVVNAPLPIFHRPPSSERDTTIMRPSDSDASSCLRIHRRPGVGSSSISERSSATNGFATEPQSPASADYLIPIPSSNYSISTEKTELQSSPSADSIDRLLELGELEDDSCAVGGGVTTNNGGEASGANKAKEHSTEQAKWEKENKRRPVSLKDSSVGGIAIGSSNNNLPESKSTQPLLEKSPSESVSGDSSSQMDSPNNGVVNMGAVTATPPLASKQAASSSSSGVALDASALAKQHPPQPLPYVNVSVSSASGGSPNRQEPFMVQTPTQGNRRRGGGGGGGGGGAGNNDIVC